MRKWILYTLFSVLLLATWQYAGSHSQTVRLLVSSPTLVAGYVADNARDLFTATHTTLIEAAAGLSIAVAFSFAIMIACLYRPKLMDFIMPLMVTSQVIPLIVLAPFFIILLGVGLSSKIAMAALICFFPIFVNFAHGYKSISSNIHDLMHIYDARLGFRIKHVYLPLSMSSIMAGIKVSATLAVIGAIVAEFSGAEVGLGKNLFVSALRLEPELMMASLFLSASIGGLLFGVIKLAEKKLVYWV